VYGLPDLVAQLEGRAPASALILEAPALAVKALDRK
jgi:hypothetical protein